MKPWVAQLAEGLDTCLTGPGSVSDLAAALEAGDNGPMNAEELDWMRRVGQARWQAKPVLHQRLKALTLLSYHERYD